MKRLFDHGLIRSSAYHRTRIRPLYYRVSIILLRTRISLFKYCFFTVFAFFLCSSLFSLYSFFVYAGYDQCSSQHGGDDEQEIKAVELEKTTEISQHGYKQCRLQEAKKGDIEKGADHTLRRFFLSGFMNILANQMEHVVMLFSVRS